MENSNEPEIDAAIAEQGAINRMRWQLVRGLAPSAAEHGVSADRLLDNAEALLALFVARHGVVK